MATASVRRVARWAGVTAVVLGLAAIPMTAFAQQSSSVDVALAGFSVTPSVQSVAPGSVTFQANIVGGRHQLTVIRTDLAPDALPLDGTTVAVGGLDVVGATDALAVGETAQVSATLAAGNYVLICNIPTHYDRGMRTAFTVSSQITPPAAGNAAIASSATSGGSSMALVALLLAAAVTVTFGGRALTSAAERRR